LVKVGEGENADKGSRRKGGDLYQGGPSARGEGSVAQGKCKCVENVKKHR